MALKLTKTFGNSAYIVGFEPDSEIVVTIDGKVTEVFEIERISSGEIVLSGDWVRYIDYAIFYADVKLEFTTHSTTVGILNLTTTELEFQERPSDSVYFNYEDFWSGKVI
jgi:hypothetical protein